MKFTSSVKAGVVAVALSASAAGVHATATTYFGNYAGANGTVVNGMLAGQDPVAQRNAFRNSLASFQQESFSGSSVGLTSQVNNLFAAASGTTLTSTQPNDPSNLTRSRIQDSAGALTGTAGWTGRFNTTGDPQSNPPASPGQWFETNKQTNTVQFGTAVSAFGTFITDAADFKGALSVQVFNGTALLLTSTLFSGAGTGNGGLAFFGYTNDATTFTSVVFTLNQQANLLPGSFDIVGFDDFLIGPLPAGSGNAPEPSSIALSALSLGLLAFARRRKFSR